MPPGDLKTPGAPGVNYPVLIAVWAREAGFRRQVAERAARIWVHWRQYLGQADAAAIILATMSTLAPSKPASASGHALWNACVDACRERYHLRPDEPDEVRTRRISTAGRSAGTGWPPPAPMSEQKLRRSIRDVYRTAPRAGRGELERGRRQRGLWRYLGGLPPAVLGAIRKEQAHLLRADGMSERDIAGGVGVSQPTVHRYLLEPRYGHGIDELADEAASRSFRR
jgi:hypothetical protein